jgi:hypothetical protein
MIFFQTASHPSPIETTTPLSTSTQTDIHPSPLHLTPTNSTTPLRQLSPYEKDQKLIETCAKKFTSSKRKWGESFFELLPSGKRRCRLHNELGLACGQVYGEKTNSSNCADHITLNHKIVTPLRHNKEEQMVLTKHESPLISTYFSPMISGAQISPQEEKVLLAYAMNPVAIQTADDGYWRAAFGSVLGSLHTKKLRTKLLQYGQYVHAEKKKLYSQSLLSIQFDGGKDISQNKIIAVSTFSGLYFLKKFILLLILIHFFRVFCDAVRYGGYTFRCSERRLL